jgi:hypothetical protein
MQNKYLNVECDKLKVEISDRASEEQITIPWNSIKLECAGNSFSPDIMDVVEDESGFELNGKSGDIDFIARLKLDSERHWCTLDVQIVSNDNDSLPTPEVLIIADSDMLEFKPVGYKYQNAYQDKSESDLASQEGEEASGGDIPGCGYPVFSENFFVGLEHVAAYTLVKERGFSCKHYPVWTDDNTITAPTLVIGNKAEFPNITKSFLNYIDQISIPKKQDPILCCCTFWSDPYMGNNEYKVNIAHYKRYIKQFLEVGITPDMLMLDAGWNDRNSIFQAKKDIGGDEGLKEISDYLASHGIDFALWTSINGNMGVSWEWAQAQGYPVGTGRGAAYSEPHQFVVLPDNDFAEKMAERYVELMDKTNSKFFKIDWDCECATNADFAEKYPTANHVRTASIDVINQIHSAVMQANPEYLMRNGWWPSPWWLKDVTFTWLAHSGDCEYAALPSLTQRDRETTHRDAMYYYIFKESQTPLPFDSIDNHEMTKAFRNPFAETHESWCNSVIMLYTRGTIYQSVMINAATMSDRQVEFFAETRKFAEQYKHILFNKSAQFIGGNPADGEVYSFLHQSSTEAIAVVRNPAMIPQQFSLAEITSEIDFPVKQTLVVYPYCNNIKADDEITLLAHQVVLIYFTQEVEMLPEAISAVPFVVGTNGDVHLSAGLEPDDSFGTIQEEFVMIRDVEIETLAAEESDAAASFYFKISIPDRMHNSCAVFELTGATEAELDQIPLRVYHDRYPKSGDGHVIAVTRIYAKKKEGYGISRNTAPGHADYNVQYRLCDLPSGGEFYLKIEVGDCSTIKDLAIKFYVSGIRGRSRQGKKLKLPEIFKHIPKTHNAGIGEYSMVTMRKM